MLTQAVSGGSYTTLARSHIRIVDSWLHNYARIRRSYTPGISWLGVGHYVGSLTPIYVACYICILRILLYMCPPHAAVYMWPAIYVSSSKIMEEAGSVWGTM